MKLRLKDSFGMDPLQKPTREQGLNTQVGGQALANAQASATYRVVGQPEDLEGAKELAEKDKYGFQWWVLPLIGKTEN